MKTTRLLFLVWIGIIVAHWPHANLSGDDFAPFAEDPPDAQKVQRVLFAAKRLSPPDLKKLASADLPLVTTRLRQALTEHDPEIGHYGPGRDELMVTLLKLDDEAGFRELERYLTDEQDRNLGRAYLWIRDAVQPSTVPILAKYLFTDEPSDVDAAVTASAEDYPRAWVTPCDLIQEVLSKSGEIDVEVKKWIEALGPNPVLGHLDEYRQVYRDWYRENEHFFLEKKYGAVKPGRMLKNPIKNPFLTEDHQSETTDAVATPPAPAPPVQEPKATVPASDFPYLWAAVALGALALLFIVLRMRRANS